MDPQMKECVFVHAFFSCTPSGNFLSSQTFGTPVHGSTLQEKAYVKITISFGGPSPLCLLRLTCDQWSRTFPLVSFPGSPHTRTKIASPYCKRWKAGWGLGMRLLSPSVSAYCKTWMVGRPGNKNLLLLHWGPLPPLSTQVDITNVISAPVPSPSISAHYKQPKPGQWEALGTRL